MKYKRRNKDKRVDFCVHLEDKGLVKRGLVYKEI